MKYLIPFVIAIGILFFWLSRSHEKSEIEKVSSDTPAESTPEESAPPAPASEPAPAPEPVIAKVAPPPPPPPAPKPPPPKPEDIVGRRPPKKYVKHDPFPKLKSFEKMVSRIHKSIKNPDEFNFALATILESEPGLRKKLIDDHYPTMFEFGDKATDKLRMELADHPGGQLVYQDLKVFPSLEAQNLDPDLPVCIVTIKYSGDTRVKTAKSLNFVFMTKDYPTNGEHNFQGIRIKGRKSTPYDIAADSIECGFISNNGQRDTRWMSLEYMHLLYTIPNDRVGIVGS